MYYAKDISIGKIVEADNASRTGSYVCPRPGCGGPVYLAKGPVQRSHFRHYPGEGSAACDDYYPGLGYGGKEVSSAYAGVEEAPFELGVVLGEFEGRWGLGLRLPEIPRDELGEMTLGVLRSAFVNVLAGRDLCVRVCALDLRPGVGTACVNIAPTLQEFRTQTSGTWPATINRNCWQLQSRGFEAKGVLFRLSRGEWTRLRANSGVRSGETLLVLADSRCPPPHKIIRGVHGHLTGSGLEWTIWEANLPGDADSDAAAWLSWLGHSLVPRQWSVGLVTPARAYGERGVAVFWLGDAPVLELDAPKGGAQSTVTFFSGSNVHSAGVKASERGTAYGQLTSKTAGITRVALAADGNASVDIAFVERPLDSATLDLLAQTPRLRVWLGEKLLEAWHGPKHTMRLTKRALPEVRVDLGTDSARTRVTVWERGKQRTWRSLSGREATATIQAALPTASLIEIDADNLGKIEFSLVHFTNNTHDRSEILDRLAGWARVQSMLAQAVETPAPTILGHGCVTTDRSVSALALVRERLALRRRRAPGGVLP